RGGGRRGLARAVRRRLGRAARRALRDLHRGSGGDVPRGRPGHRHRERHDADLDRDGRPRLAYRPASSPDRALDCRPRGRRCLDRAARSEQYPGVSGPALIHVVVSGLATGCIYALVALSLVIVYNATRTVNFAQGELLMISAFVAWTARRPGLPLAAALVSGVAAGGLLAFLLERAIIRRAVSATHWDVLIITLGLSLALRA